MLNIVLYEPEIPPNTGNIIRLASNTGFGLHIIKPMGFELDDKRLRRAGLDYAEWQRIHQHDSWQSYCNYRTEHCASSTVWAISTKGKHYHHQAAFKTGDHILFGPETRGLPAHVLSSLHAEQILRIPMRANSRSLNLSNSVAIVTYSAWQTLGFSESV